MTDPMNRARWAARWWDLPGLLVGVRPSIQRLIHARQGWLFAAVLVATAALGREYDAVSLWHQPYDLLGSFAASLLLSSLLFLWMWAGMALCGFRLVRPWRHALVFLTGYWLTAPLAWFYAFPIEAFSDEVPSLRFNLTALSVVSIWRVLLFARISSIQFRIPFAVTLFWILVPCMAVAFFGLLSSMMSMVSIMGGIRLSQSQQMLVDYQGAVLVGLWWSFLPVVAVAIALTVWLAKRGGSKRASRRLPRVSWQAWLIPLAALVTLAAGTVRFQPALQRAHRVDQMLVAGELDRAIAEMAKGGEAAFPPAWDPQPQFDRNSDQRPKISELVRTIQTSGPPAWVIDRLMVQADEILLLQNGWRQGVKHLSVERGELLYLAPSDLRALIEDLEGTLELPLRDRELSDSFRNILEVVRKSLEMVNLNEVEIPSSTDERSSAEP